MHRQVRHIPWDDLPGATTYPLSKLLNILFGYELARRLAGTGLTANIADPGFVPRSPGWPHAASPSTGRCGPAR